MTTKYTHLAIRNADGFNWMSACKKRVGIMGTTGSLDKVTCPKCLVAMVIAASKISQPIEA